VSSELRIAVITSSAVVPDLSDQEGWNEADRLRDLLQALRHGGYELAGVLGAGADLGDRLTALNPDLLVVDAESGARDALEHVVLATRRARRPIVLFTDDDHPDNVREAVAAGVVAYVARGLPPERVRPVIDVAMARYEHEAALRAELELAQNKLREREQIDKAKALLIQRHQLTEPQAYARLRKTAMNNGLPLAEVARRLLELAELFED